MVINLRSLLRSAGIVLLAATVFLAGWAVAGASGTPAVESASSGVSEPEEVSLPILMYHGILEKGKLLEQYVVSAAEFESDLQYLTTHGYQTVVMRDVIDYVKTGKPLPEKPVMITFDDGYYNNYRYAYPLLQKYNCRMVLSPIGRWAEFYSQTGEEHVNYSHATFKQLKEMMDSGLVELQNHSYNMHSNDGGRKGAKKKAVESLTEYQAVLSEDVGRMQQLLQEQLGYTPTTFTYPFGAISAEALPILKKMGFEAALTCESRINRLTRDPECLYRLGRYLRPHGVSSEQFFTKTVKLS